MIKNLNYEEMRSRIINVLHENGESVKTVDGVARYVLNELKNATTMDIEPLFDFVVRYNCKLDYICGLTDEMY